MDIDWMGWLGVFTSLFDEPLAWGIVIGLVLGWNILPQPEWVRSLWNRLMQRLTIEK